MSDERSMFEPGEPAGRDWGVLGTMAGWSWRILICTAALALIVAILIQMKFVVVPLLLALLISSVLSPLTSVFERRGMSRGLSSTLTVFVAVGVLVGFVLIAIPPFLRSLDDFKVAFDNSGDELYAWLSGSPFNFSDAQIADLKEQIRNALPALKDWLVQGVKAAAPLILQATAMVGLTIVLIGYLLAGGDRYWQWVLGFFSPVNRPGINELGESAYRKLATYLQATAQMAALYGAGVGIFAFIFDVRLAGVLGVIVFMLAFLPIIGAWVSGALVAAMSFVSGGIWTMVGMVLVMLVLSQVNSIFIRPRVVGERVSLVPVVTLTTVLAGTTIGGVIGGILAVPLVATISGALGQVRRWRAEGGVPTADPIIDKRLDPDVEVG
ncbi:MAG: AI-2E family transporter [Thermoleophilaceae bacterium]|nr:AI-2E family transporter [Thermoleophilaceae bacterium]